MKKNNSIKSIKGKKYILKKNTKKQGSVRFGI